MEELDPPTRESRTEWTPCLLDFVPELGVIPLHSDEVKGRRESDNLANEIRDSQGLQFKDNL